MEGPVTPRKKKNTKNRNVTHTPTKALKGLQVPLTTLIQVYMILRPSCTEVLVGDRLTFCLVEMLDFIANMHLLLRLKE